MIDIYKDYRNEQTSTDAIKGYDFFGDHVEMTTSGESPYDNVVGIMFPGWDDF